MDLKSRYNYYDILEINPSCPQHEITSAYERAKATYSGENPAIYTMFNEDEARNLLQLIEEAYSVLGNKILRTLYDDKIGQKSPVADLTFESLQTESRAVFNTVPKKTPSTKMDYKVDESMEKELKDAEDWNGPLLKKVREYKKLSLESLSEITKISSYYIRAVESVDPKNLPAPVYVRGYVSQIAKTLGLEEKKVCESYMKNFKSTIEGK
jgi:curved DNA-binding protein CbpA